MTRKDCRQTGAKQKSVFIGVHPWLDFRVLNVIHEDADLLVVHKPAGLVCHPTKDGELSSLIGRARLYLLREGCKPEEKLANEEPLSPSQSSRENPQLKIQNSKSTTCHLVNRLDRETSGVVLIAKNSQAAGELGKALESRAIEKEYLAIVHGHVGAESGTINAPLGKDEHSRVAIKDCVRSDGAPAQTDFFVERRFVYSGRAGSPLPTFAASVGTHGVTRPIPPLSILHSPPSFSLLRLVPRSGRKHQIRIHLAHMGHPIVGEKIYGGDEDCYLAFVQGRLSDAQRARLIFENHALHARAIRFFWRNRQWEFASPPEPWFTGFLSADCTD
ncbi:MAG TPA: RluA family pseudouridine synthase [Verrucomicrobiae bacterium]|nr:RluA family pseudouridine synthase [Verrucomicrobiae bacterium]